MTLPDNRAAARYVKKNSILNQQLSCNNTWWKFPIPDHRWVLSRQEFFLWWPLTTTKPPSIHLPGPSDSSETTLTNKGIWEWKITQQGQALPAIHGSPAPQLLPLPFLSLHYQSIIEECLSTVVSFLTRQQPTILFWEMGLWTGTDWLQYSSPTLTECGTTFPQMGPWQWSWSDFSRWCYLPRTTTVAVGGSSS